MNRKQVSCLLFSLLGLAVALPGRPAQASSEPFLGEIMWVPYNFAPTGWAFCDGQLLAISQNTALFSLLGTQYGGNGQTTFALPNMQGRVLINAGQGPGLSDYYQGESGGEENHTLTSSEIPSHSHTVKATVATGTATSPTGAYLGAAATGNQYGDAPTTTMAPGALAVAGSTMPHNNMMPYLTLNCIIALQGIFPAHPN